MVRNRISYCKTDETHEMSSQASKNDLIHRSNIDKIALNLLLQTNLLIILPQVWQYSAPTAGPGALAFREGRVDIFLNRLGRGVGTLSRRLNE